jgi:hypothetical protein
MRQTTASTLVIVASLFLFSSMAPTLAGGKGGGGGKGGSQKSGAPARAGQQGAQSSRATSQKLQLKSAQMTQLRLSGSDAARMQTQTKSVIRTTKGSFDPTALRQEGQNIQAGVRSMYEKHDGMMNGLAAGARTQLADREQRIDQIRTRIDQHLGAMNRELAKADPSGKRVRQEAKQLETAMNQWRKQHRKLEGDFVVSSG